MTASDLVITEIEGGVATLSLNDPKRLNILSKTMLAALERAIKDVSADTTVRVILLRANGRAFCAGHDLGELEISGEGDAENCDALFETCTRVMLSLHTLPQPIIALVQGVATAAGCQLVASCDMAIASENAKFGLNGIDVGLFCSTPMVAASRAMDPRRCFEMLVSGRFLSAPDAMQAGLINRCVPADTLEGEGQALAADIARKDPNAIALGKRAFYEQLEAPLKDAYGVGQQAILRNLAMPETQAKIRHFRQRRK